MLIQRQKLLSILEHVKPALAGKSLIVGFDHVWFADDMVYAYNGVISIDAPFEQPFKGGLLGDILIKFIASCSDDAIDLESTNSSINIRAGKSHLTLPILSLEKASRTFPEINSEGELIGEGFCTALDNNLISINKTSALAAYSGVLLEEADDGQINMFSTDSKSLTWEKVDASLAGLNGHKVLLPGEFCSQLLKLHDENTLGVLEEGYAALTNTKDLRLISNVLDPEGAPNYLGAINKHLRNSDNYCPIPANFKSVLERIELVKGDRSDEPIKLAIIDNVLHVSIVTALGAAQDQIELNGVHPDISVVIDSSLILRALSKYQEFTVTNGALIMRNNACSYHLISTMQS